MLFIETLATMKIVQSKMRADNDRELINSGVKSGSQNISSVAQQSFLLVCVFRGC